MIQELLALWSLYEQKKLIGKYSPEVGPVPIAPVGCQVKKIGSPNGKGDGTVKGFVMTVTDDGELIKVEQMPDGYYIYPTTEDAMARRSGIFPHILNDETGYFQDEKGKAYLEQLRSWCESKYANETACAVLAYLENNSVKEVLDEYAAKCNSNKEKKEKDMVIDRKDWVFWQLAGETPSWEDLSLMKDANDWYVNCFREEKGWNRKRICTVTGEYEIPAMKYHMHDGTNAFITANEKPGRYNYSGSLFGDCHKCDDVNHIAAISYYVEQKYSNILRWLIAGYAVRRDDVTYLSWTSDGVREALFKPPAGMFDFRMLADIEIEDPLYIEKQEDFKQSVADRLDGRKNRFCPKGKVYFMSYIKNGKGRISFCDPFEEMNETDAVRNITEWAEKAAWIYPAWEDKKRKEDVVKSPSLRNLYGAIFVNPSDYHTNILNKKEYYMAIKIMRDCMVHGKKLPKSYVDMAVRKTIQAAVTAKSCSEWLARLSLTCSLINLENDGKAIEWDETREDDSFQYGRALALMDYIEYNAVDSSKKLTDAKMRMAKFQREPKKTLQEMYLKTNAVYYKKLGDSKKRFCERELDSILRRISEPEREKVLSHSFLLGYFYENKKLFRRKTADKAA